MVVDYAGQAVDASEAVTDLTVTAIQAEQHGVGHRNDTMVGLGRRSAERADARAAQVRRRPRYVVTVCCLFVVLVVREICIATKIHVRWWVPLPDRVLTEVSLLRTDLTEIASVVDKVMLDKDTLSAMQRATGLLVLLEAGLLEPRVPDPAPWDGREGSPCAPAVLDDARRLARYSTASYGWAMLNSFFLPNAQRLPDVLASSLSDDTAELNERLALRHTGAAELLHAQWATTTAPSYVPAHFVAVDAHMHDLVVSVRGTGHPLDVIADLRAWPETIEWPDGRKGRVHAGMHTAARGLLGQLLPRLRQWLSSEQFVGYGVCVVGHSLGGGTAALLALQLRAALPAAVRVRAFAMATPAVLDLASARRASDIVTSVVAGSDVVPSLCIASLQQLGRSCRRAYLVLEARAALLAAGIEVRLRSSGLGVLQWAVGNWTAADGLRIDTAKSDSSRTASGANGTAAGPRALQAQLRELRQELFLALANATRSIPAERVAGMLGSAGTGASSVVGDSGGGMEGGLYPAGRICHLHVPAASDAERSRAKLGSGTARAGAHERRGLLPPEHAWPSPSCVARAVASEAFSAIRISPQAFTDHLPSRYEHLLDECALVAGAAHEPGGSAAHLGHGPRRRRRE